MKTERPSDEELKEMIEVYGPPSFSEREVYLQNVEYEADTQKSKGEVVVEVKDEGKILAVRSETGKRYVLPQGKLSRHEDMIEGVKRVVFEKTNFDVEIIRLKEIRRIQIKFSDELVERWYFLFETKIRKDGSEEYKPKDIKFLDEVPPESELSLKR